MERIAIAGVSMHGTDVSGLELIRRPSAAEEDAYLRDLADALGASEVVFLATCNRVEVIYAREEGDPPSTADLEQLAAHVGGERAADVQRMLVLHTGREAAHHLFRVASSLDSLVVGEDQIIAQVREAYGRASDIGLVGSLLGPLFHHALAVGKQVRADTELARHPISVVTLAVQSLVERADEGPLSIGVVGAGEMGSLLARTLSATGLPPAVVTNRTAAAACTLANECKARAVELDAFRRREAPVDALVCATSAPGLVLDEETLLRLAQSTPSGKPLLAIDLAVPRDLASVDDPRVNVVDLDALRARADANRSLRAEAAVVAEQIVERKVDTWAQRFGERAAAEAVTELQAVSQEILGRELQGLLSGRLAHLNEADRRAVERWVRATFGRLMHLPVTALKRLAHDMTHHDDDIEELEADGVRPEPTAEHHP
jgi:glutamyl-tRNA reductase